MKASPQQYRPEIDGLRAIAVLPVMFFHAGYNIAAGGFVGVDVFFVVSGYLITSILLRDLQSGNYSIMSFYERRARRILPALFLVIFACIPAAWIWLPPSDHLDFSQSILAVLGFVSNILFWWESGYFDVASESKPLLHTWSLAVEEQYYLFFPLALAWAWRRGRKYIGWMIAAVAVASLILAQTQAYTSKMAGFFLLPARAWELMIGAGLAVYVFRADHALGISTIWREIVSIVGLLLIGVAILTYDKTTPFPSIYALVPTVGTALVILCADASTRIGQLLAHKMLVGIGAISYSAYLWHQPVFAFARHAHVEHISKYAYLGLILLSLAAAYISWKYVEAPFRDRKRMSAKTLWQILGTCAILLACVGLAGVYTKGFVMRFSEADQRITTHYFDQDIFNSSAFDQFNLKPFSGEKPKILLIGDSFAKDMTNVLEQGGLLDSMQLSTHMIGAHCGNLHLEQDLSAFIDPTLYAGCEEIGWYSKPALRRLLHEADQVWLVSNWLDWSTKLLPESVANLQQEYDDKFVVFGIKRFGRVNQHRMLAVPEQARANFKSPLYENHVQLNEQAKQLLAHTNYIDLIGLLCDEAKQCSTFTADGDLISSDGGHLTLPGAQHVAEQLLMNAEFRILLESAGFSPASSQ